MFYNKKIVRGIIVMMCTLAVLCTASFADTSEVKSQEVSVADQNATAGIIATLDKAEVSLLDTAQAATLTVEKTEVALVTEAGYSGEAVTPQAIAASTESADAASGAAVETETTTGAAVSAETATGAAVSAEEKEQSKTEKQWKKKAMADVESSLSIREKADRDSDIVGKMYPTTVVTVVKKGETWTKIQSGSIKGYVKTSYLLFGADAYANAKKVCKTYAYVKTDGLRVRAKANTDAKVLTTADKGDKLTYNKKADTVDGWVAVTVNKTTGYVKAKHVTVKLGTTKAVSIDKIASTKSTASSAVSASSDDVTLLAALIECEAGGESYTGKVAVGAVVLNRMRSSRFPNSISGVIYQSGQFSPVRNGALSRRLSSTISSSCRQAALDALAGSDPTGGTLYFHRVDGCRGQVIGNHVFY